MVRDANIFMLATTKIKPLGKIAMNGLDTGPAVAVWHRMVD